MITKMLSAAAAVALLAGTASAAWHEPAGAAKTPQPAAAGTTTVELAEWTLGFTELALDGGKTRLTVTNRGGATHALTIEGSAGGKTIRVNSPLLKPGQTATLEVDLPPGEYVAYCPVGGHRALGMEGTIRIGS